MTGVSIRLLAPDDDAAAIGEMTVAAYLTNEGDTDTGYHTELRRVARRARHCPVLVAVDDDSGAIVGTVTYVPGPDNPFAELERGDEAGFRMLAVAPGAQGRGIGRALANACVERARAHSRGGLAIFTRPTARSAQALYDSMDFVRDPERDWQFAPGEWLWAFALRFLARQRRCNGRIAIRPIKRNHSGWLDTFSNRANPEAGLRAVRNRTIEAGPAAEP